MTIKAEIGGEGLEIWFTPSFNIKATRPDLPAYLRDISMEVYDPNQTRMRTVKITQGEWEAYLMLEHIRINFPKLKVKITEHPEQEREDNDIEKELLY